MSGLLFLSKNNFYVTRGAKGPIMCNHLRRGFSLVLFYSGQCPNCPPYAQAFKALPGTIDGCQFAMANATDRDIRAMSRGTLTELKYVPYILLYSDGRPLVKYGGPPDPRTILRFIVDMANQVQKPNQSFTSNPRIQEDPSGGIPKYSLGKPVCGDDVCYFEFDDAYTPGAAVQKQGGFDGAGMGFGSA